MEIGNIQLLALCPSGVDPTSMECRTRWKRCRTWFTPASAGTWAPRTIDPCECPCMSACAACDGSALGDMLAHPAHPRRLLRLAMALYGVRHVERLSAPTLHH